jgi:protein-L-isoaspartate(D-aspartate) O-methyltransferase
MNRFKRLLRVEPVPAAEPSPPPDTSPPDEFAVQRRQMVAEQLACAGRDINDTRVLAAMSAVPRHVFVPESVRERSYWDQPLPIGYHQTISQPYIVAFMIAQLQLAPHERVLEIGTGSGYQAAVLAELGTEVYTIEIIESLAEKATAILQRLGYAKIHVRAGDGHAGWPEAAPFDAMVVACAPEAVPRALMDQLKEGGRMIIPVGNSWDQELVRLKKQGETVWRESVLAVRFVPMTGGQERETHESA